MLFQIRFQENNNKKSVCGKSPQKTAIQVKCSYNTLSSILNIQNYKQQMQKKCNKKR